MLACLGNCDGFDTTVRAIATRNTSLDNGFEFHGINVPSAADRCEIPLWRRLGEIRASHLFRNHGWPR